MGFKSNIRQFFLHLSSGSIASAPKMWRSRVDARLTEAAIEKAKVEIAKRGLEVTDLSDEQVELIVSDERDKILNKMKDRSWSAILVLLGIQVI
ncbi:hypothetical protein N9N22_03045 [Alphaproteobacteria bacterium]|nr:hypothetical protein [Alphaproteobacteria bacterium]